MKRASSLQEFMELLDTDPRLTVVTVAPHQEPIGLYSHHPVTGFAADHRLSILYAATGRWGRKVTCLEELMVRLRTARGIQEESPMQRRDTLTCFITADQRVQELSKRFPDRTICLAQPNGPIDPDLAEELREEAAELDIVPISP